MLTPEGIYLLDDWGHRGIDLMKLQKKIPQVGMSALVELRFNFSRCVLATFYSQNIITQNGFFSAKPV